MNLSSPKLSFNNRLLAVEELFRQRQYKIASKEFLTLVETDFVSIDHEHGLYHSLKAEVDYYNGNYKEAIKAGLFSARKIANLPLNKRFGRVQLILSKSYSAIGDMKNAEIRAADSLSSFRRCSDDIGQADALNELARVNYIRCNYAGVVGYLEDALLLVRNNPRKTAQITSNLARIRIRTGQWDQAETELNETIEYNRENKEEVSLALSTLSLGILNIRRRKFILSAKHLDNALEIISRLNLKREKVIHLEFAGELAFEKGDMFKAKSILSSAYEKGMILAPGSALVSQSARRLAEVELVLDNIDDAMKYGQKALESSLSIGEKLEIGLSRRVIAQIFAAKKDFSDAVEYVNQAVEIIREVGDQWEVSRSLLIQADILIASKKEKPKKIMALYDEAHKLFRKLKLDYWLAETNFRSGMYACHQGDISVGFNNLSVALKLFEALNDNIKVRAVGKFLSFLSEQAVALSVSQENEFKVFGKLITPDELSNIKTSNLDEILNILLKRTSADRALIYSSEFEDEPISASFTMTSYQMSKFADNFENILGEEISKSKPTLILDCRRDPFINNLFTDSVEVVASVIVIPFKLSDQTTSYLYLDKLSRKNTLNPFGQSQLNFAVGYSDLIAFKWSEIQKHKLIEDNLRLKHQLREQAAFPNMITCNENMLQLLEQVRQIIDSNISITIEGETGTGKDVLARAIHYNSNRRDKRFISVNCAALPETLLESELFGYKRGAFTGADRDKPGLFEAADQGTFFLDEIGDMPLSIQAKVLRVLEEKELVRLGETVPRKVDVRIVSATNHDLKELMASKSFRQDLYYRLSAMTFKLPPLRSRREDIPLLIDHFLKAEGKKISPESVKLFVKYDWPGNIRELENEIKKLVLFSGNKDDIDDAVMSSRIATASGMIPINGDVDAEIPDEVVFDENYSLYDYLSHHERRFIIKALKEKNGVKKHAADLLNIPESTLRLKIKQYGIDLKKIKNK